MKLSLLLPCIGIPLLAWCISVAIFESYWRLVGGHITSDRIDPYIESIMRGGHNRARLIFKTTFGRLEFLKRITREGVTAFFLILRRQSNSLESFENAKRFLASNGIVYTLKNIQGVSQESPVIIVNIAQDIVLASKIAHYLLDSAVGPGQRSRLRVARRGVINVRPNVVVGWNLKLPDKQLFLLNKVHPTLREIIFVFVSMLVSEFAIFRIPDKAIWHLWPLFKIMITILYLATIVMGIRRWRANNLAWRRVEYGLCWNCGYDWRSSGQRCPECGVSKDDMFIVN